MTDTPIIPITVNYSEPTKVETDSSVLPNKVHWKFGAARKIKHQLGQWYIIVHNIQAQRWFNGLPPQQSAIQLLDDNVRKNAENQVDGYEMVYEVISVPEYDTILTEGQNNFINVPPIVGVGDIVLCKGNVLKIHAEPVMYAATRANFTAMLALSADKEELFRVE